MRGKFGIAALIFSSISFAAPVSTPNQLSDTPIIAGGGSGGKLSMNNCRAYQTNNAAINLSGGETLVFYGGGWSKSGGYLATKTTYSGTAYVKLSKMCDSNYECYGDDTAIGLFARNTRVQQDFIAGAGGDYGGLGGGPYNSDYCSPASGGGWQGESAYCHRAGQAYYAPGGSVYYSGRSVYYIRNVWLDKVRGWNSSAGFYGGYFGGGASSISAFYNSYTKNYTSPPTSATITGGGITTQGLLYVCQ